MSCEIRTTRVSTLVVLAALAGCEVPDLSGTAGSAEETAQLEEALDGDWDATAMELDDPSAALEAVRSITLLDTWVQLDDQVLDLAADLAAAEDPASCVTYTVDGSVESAVGECDSAIDGADMRGSITVTSTATGGYESLWEDLEVRSDGLRVDGEGVVSWDATERVLSLSVARGWTASGGGGASGAVRLFAEGDLGQQGLIFAGELIVDEHTDLPAGALRFAVTSYPESGDTGRTVSHTLIRGDQDWELIRYDDDGAEGCHVLKQDGATVEDTCGA